MTIKEYQIEKWFSPKAIPGNENDEVDNLRTSSKDLARLIISSTPVGSDQSHAIRHIRDALQSAAQAVVFNK